MGNESRNTDHSLDDTRQMPEWLQHKTVDNRTKPTSRAVHALLGNDVLHEGPGYADEKNKLWGTDEHPTQHHPTTVAVTSPHADRRWTNPDTRTIEQQGISDDRLMKNALSVGVTTGAASVASASVTAAGSSLLYGSAATAGMLAAAPLAGGTIGYFVGNRLKHPVVGAAVGSAVGGAGMLTAIGTVTGGGIGGGLTAGALAASMWPAALYGATTYGLGEIHNYVWHTPGKERPGVAGTLLRGMVSPITIPAGLIYKGGKRLVGRG